MKKAILIISVILAAVLGASAQNPVSLSMSVTPTSIPSGGSGTARVTASIEGGWYLYSITQPPGGPIQTRVALGEGPFKAGRVTGPRPKVKMDPNFGMNTESYSGTAVFTIPFTVEAGTPEGPQTVNASVRFQACNDSVCLPPRTVRLSSAVTIIAPRSAQPSPSPTAAATPSPTRTPASNSANTDSNTALAELSDGSANDNGGANTDQAAPVENFYEPEPGAGNADGQYVMRPAETRVTEMPLWAFIWLAMTFGALSLLTPCVFPMIPITVSYFTKHGAESTAGSIRDAFIYALGIIFTFTGLGVLLAIIFGAAGINRFASNPYINLLIAGIFLAFAFSLLGAYNLSVPSGVLTKLDNLTRSKESGRMIGLLLMGLTFSLTSFTCTAPLVGTILVAAAQGDLLYPMIGMLAFSAVFALPFFVLAVAPQWMQSLPRSGSWMNAVKVVMGFLEIGAALKFISNVDLVWGWDIFTREVVIAGWIALAVMIFLYLLGVFRFSHDSDDRTIGLVRVLNAFLFGTLAFYLLTGLFGARLGELESFLPYSKPGSSSATVGGPMSNELSWINNDYQAALQQAKAENKNIFIDFTGYTCTNCRWMEANMFPKPAIKAELEKFVRVKLFTDGEGEPYEGFQKMQEQRFGTVALPLYALITPEDSVKATFEGLTRDENEFVTFLRK
ncbi:MAG TPA: cytochrome c biogenesis protein CcdA [Pyrinomonadaceae bacterium]|nr:cytochrome c biogenesis protein CcdA [Pyrinomonadaceae bacterium]